MVGGTGELRSVCRGAAVDRAEVHVASLGMPRQKRREWGLLGPVSLLWQGEAFSQPGQKPAEHRPSSSPCTAASLAWQVFALLQPLTSINSIFHFLSCFFQLLIICPFSGLCSVRLFSFLWCTKFPLIVCVCLYTCSIIALESTVVKSCSFHELNEQMGK